MNTTDATPTSPFSPEDRETVAMLLRLITTDPSQEVRKSSVRLLRAMCRRAGTTPEKVITEALASIAGDDLDSDHP
jgi:hypothetical protein